MFETVILDALSNIFPPNYTILRAEASSMHGVIVVGSGKLFC